MSIRPVDTTFAASLNLVKKETEQGGRSFQDALTAAAGNGSAVAGGIPAARKAELLRLSMMRSALSFDGTAAVSPFNGNRMETLIAAYATGSDNSVSVSTEQASFVSSSSNAALAPPEATVPAAVAGGSALSITAVINRASQRYGVEENLIKAVIKAESNFKATAVSSAGAQGLMQLMPATAAGLGVKDSFNPEQNVMAGTRFLKDLLNRYGGDLDKALAAYNWGPGNLDRGKGRLPLETREYLLKVKKYYTDYSLA